MSGFEKKRSITGMINNELPFILPTIVIVLNAIVMYLIGLAFCNIFNDEISKLQYEFFRETRQYLWADIFFKFLCGLCFEIALFILYWIMYGIFYMLTYIKLIIKSAYLPLTDDEVDNAYQKGLFDDAQSYVDYINKCVKSNFFDIHCSFDNDDRRKIVEILFEHFEVDIKRLNLEKCSYLFDSLVEMKEIINEKGRDLEGYDGLSGYKTNKLVILYLYKENGTYVCGALDIRGYNKYTICDMKHVKTKEEIKDGKIIYELLKEGTSDYTFSLSYR